MLNSFLFAMWVENAAIPAFSQKLGSYPIISLIYKTLRSTECIYFSVVRGFLGLDHKQLPTRVPDSMWLGGSWSIVLFYPIFSFDLHGRHFLLKS